jgi:hypothetical protein
MLWESRQAEMALQGVDLISGPSLGAYQLPGNGQAIILLDEYRQVRFAVCHACYHAYAYHRYIFTLRQPRTKKNLPNLLAD